MVKNKKAYIPKRGDIVWLTLSPTQGHEEGGRRPAMVLSRESYNKLIGLAVVVPITKKIKGYNFEVKISIPEIEGVVLSDHARSVAYANRDVDYIGQAPKSVIDEVIQKLSALIE